MARRRAHARDLARVITAQLPVDERVVWLRGEVEARELSGPVRTLADMPPEQRAALERELGAPIRRRSGHTPGQVPDRRS
jgi:hypothetical protein